MDALNEIMFRTALVAIDFPRDHLLNKTTNEYWTRLYESKHPDILPGDDGVSMPQLLPVHQTTKVAVFQSEYPYLL